MQRVLKRILKICPSLTIKLKRIYKKNSSSYTKSNICHKIKSSCIKETYAQGVVDHRFVEEGWYPHIKTDTGWYPIALGDGDYVDDLDYPSHLHYYKVSRKKGKARRLQKEIIYLYKEVHKNEQR